MFKVHLGYKAWYVIGDNLSRLSPGTYRYHDGQMQINLHGEWKRYRHDEEDF